MQGHPREAPDARRVSALRPSPECGSAPRRVQAGCGLRLPMATWAAAGVTGRHSVVSIHVCPGGSAPTPGTVGHGGGTRPRHEEAPGSFHRAAPALTQPEQQAGPRHSVFALLLLSQCPSRGRLSVLNATRCVSLGFRAAISDRACFRVSGSCGRSAPSVRIMFVGLCVSS